MADDAILLTFERVVVDLSLEEFVDSRLPSEKVLRLFELRLVLRQFLI